MDITRFVPEYLLKEVETTSTEFIEKYEPNSITITAGVMENLINKLRDYDTWNDFDSYVKEFKIDEIFPEPGTIYNLTQPELLKGFFTYKGTDLDLVYISKLFGIDLSVLEDQHTDTVTFSDGNIDRNKIKTCSLSTLSRIDLDNTYFKGITEDSNIEYVINKVLSSRLYACVNISKFLFILTMLDQYLFQTDDDKVQNVNTTEIVKEPLYYISRINKTTKYGGIYVKYQKDSNFFYNELSDFKYNTFGSYQYKYGLYDAKYRDIGIFENNKLDNPIEYQTSVYQGNYGEANFKYINNPTVQYFNHERDEVIVTKEYQYELYDTVQRVKELEESKAHINAGSDNLEQGIYQPEWSQIKFGEVVLESGVYGTANYLFDSSKLYGQSKLYQFGEFPHKFVTNNGIFKDVQTQGSKEVELDCVTHCYGTSANYNSGLTYDNNRNGNYIDEELIGAKSSLNDIVRDTNETGYKSSSKEFQSDLVYPWYNDTDLHFSNVLKDTTKSELFQEAYESNVIEQIFKYGDDECYYSSSTEVYYSGMHRKDTINIIAYERQPLRYNEKLWMKFNGRYGLKDDDFNIDLIYKQGNNVLYNANHRYENKIIHFNEKLQFYKL